MFRFIALIPLLCAFCAGPRTVAGGNCPTIDAIRDATPVTIRAFGDVEISVEGEKFRGKIDVCDRPGGAFRCDCFDAFGGTVVSMSADADSVEISMGGNVYLLSLDGPLAAVPYFRKYPFTFIQLKRILTGRLPEDIVVDSPPDSSWLERRSRVERWTGDSISVVVKTSLRTGRLERISMGGSTEMWWRLVFSNFDGGMAKEIRFETHGKNYFIFRFQRVQVDEITCDT